LASAIIGRDFIDDASSRATVRDDGNDAEST